MKREKRTCDWVRSRRGVAITTTGAPPLGYKGQPYDFQLAAWGGAQPYRWSWAPTDADGLLPPGLELDPATGLVWGDPTIPGRDPVTIVVESASYGAYSKQPQSFGQRLEIVVETVQVPVLGAALGQMHPTRSGRPFVSRDPGELRTE